MTGAAASPALPAPFRADRAERLALPVSYVLAYLYVDLFWFTPSAPLQRLLLTAFTVLFCAGTELLFRREKPSAESFVWLGCLLALLASIAAGRCRVWGGWSVLFLHGFAVYGSAARGRERPARPARPAARFSHNAVFLLLPAPARPVGHAPHAQTRQSRGVGRHRARARAAGRGGQPAQRRR